MPYQWRSCHNVPESCLEQSSCRGELELDTRGDPTVRFSLEVEVEEEDKLLSVLSRLELLGWKILKGKAASSISNFSNKDISRLESRSACLMLGYW